MLKLNWKNVFLLLVVLHIAACVGTPSKENKVLVTLAVNSDSNPDATGRPSPVVVRFYQLKDDGKFNTADFFPLFDNDQQVLGSDLLAREELELLPGETKQLTIGVANEAKFVAALVAYRDIRNAKWREVKAAPKAGLLSIVSTSSIKVSIGRGAVTVDIPN